MPPPRLIVFSSLFPNSTQPTAGLFIRERMFRVGKHLPLVVVSPKPWFPGQGLIRRFRPHYRPMPVRMETQAGFEVHFPRFLAIPGLFRGLDSLFMALGSYPTLRRLKARGHNLIDAHFAYPDGHAAIKLGRWLGLPVTVTLRGTEVPQSRNPALLPKLREVFRDADFVITVSDSLRQSGLLPRAGPGAGPGRGQRRRCRPLHPRPPGRSPPALRLARYGQGARHRRRPGGAQGLPSGDRLPARPAGATSRPALPVVGGPCPEGDMTQALKDQVAALDLGERVHFLGPVPRMT
jgi:teichuronic acid biosynthesis glycosyltransferase TuaC